jgi:hypothetical protein
MNLLIINTRLTFFVFFLYFFYVLPNVSAYPFPFPQAVVPQLVTGPSSTHPASTAAVQLALSTLFTPPYYSTSESSTLFPATTTFQSPSFPSDDAVPASRPSLNPTVSVSIIPTLDPLDSSPGPNVTPLSIATATATTPLAPQPSEQAPFSPPQDYQTVSLPAEIPHSSSDPWVLAPEHSTAPMNNSFVIGVVFASMFVFMIVCLLILRCSRWYKTKHTSIPSPNLTRNGSFSNSSAMEKRKWMRGTLFDVETGVVENLAGIGRAAREFISLRSTLRTLTENAGTSYGIRATWLQR